MRADRLLSMMMLLQTRGMQKASSLAEELEVTERTIYRDITALSSAGVPVYTIKGPGGGIALLEEYRTNLTGLTAEEVKALFMLSIPPVLEQLGVEKLLQSAFLKLSSALPASLHSDEIKVRQLILLDASPWQGETESVPCLQICQDALWQSCVLDMRVLSFFNTELNMRFAPYGLVAKGNSWYLVGDRDGVLYVYEVRKIVSARKLELKFERPLDFNLGSFWKNWCKEQSSSRSQYKVNAKVTPQLAKILEGHPALNIPLLPMQAGTPLEEIILSFDNFVEARSAILSYGGAIEVIEPLALRKSVADYASQIISRYENTRVSY